MYSNDYGGYYARRKESTPIIYRFFSKVAEFVSVPLLAAYLLAAYVIIASGLVVFEQFTDHTSDDAKVADFQKRQDSPHIDDVENQARRDAEMLNDIFSVEPAAGDNETEAGVPAVAGADAEPGNLFESGTPIIIEGTAAGLEEAARNLTVRYERLRILERDLAAREAVMASLRERLLADIDRFSALRDEVALLLQELDEEEARKLARLVKTYETMKAKKAAAIFNRLELDVLIPVLDEMREAKLAAIMAAMDPVKAKIVTARLAKKTELPDIPAR